MTRTSPRRYAKIRSGGTKRGQMNRTEAAFAAELELRKAAGEVRLWRYEAVKFVVGESTCFYTPDFMVLLADDTIEFVDVKGSGPIEEASKVKIKAAALQYPEFRWVIAQALRKKDGGGFGRREIG